MEKLRNLIQKTKAKYGRHMYRKCMKNGDYINAGNWAMWTIKQLSKH